MINVQIKLFNPEYSPKYSTDGSAGMDLMACIPHSIAIPAGETLLIPTGISIFIENKDVCAIILPRSGLGHKHGIVLGNLVGLIDSDYQGELKVSCWNRSDKSFLINPGDRIAQLVFIPVLTANFLQVDDFSRTLRGVNGFGSTGK